jgi:hypothetical protein
MVVCRRESYTKGREVRVKGEKKEEGPEFCRIKISFVISVIMIVMYYFQ